VSSTFVITNSDHSAVASSVTTVRVFVAGAPQGHNTVTETPHNTVTDTPQGHNIVTDIPQGHYTVTRSP
jgi:hypothetical protein